MADKNFLTEIIDADLAEGKISEIHTRFPPEPNGYLHIGSAKAIYINWSIANQYGGKFNLRLDDTNPAREGEEYVKDVYKRQVTDLFAQPFNHHPVIEKGLRADEAQQLLQEFFVSLRARRAAKPRWKPPVNP